MKFLYIFLISVFVLFSCNEKKNSSIVLIKTEKSIVKIDETFRAELSVAHLDSIIPNFYFVVKKDTFYIPFYKETECAVFQAGSKKEGQKTIEGFVEYVDLKGLKRKESFLLKYSVMGDK